MWLQVIKEYRAIFEMYDIDHDGFIDCGEIERVLKLHGIVLSEDAIKKSLNRSVTLAHCRLATDSMIKCTAMTATTTAV